MLKLLLSMTALALTVSCSHMSHSTCASKRIPASKSLSCSALIKSSSFKQLAVDPDPMKQLMLWEQLSNTKRWEKPTTSVQLEYVLLPPSEVNTNNLKLPDYLKNILYDEKGRVRWFQHPHNTSDLDPYLGTAPDGAIEAHYSASRSMFVTIDDNLFTFKLPTDNPHPEAHPQRAKADLVNDSVISMRRSRHVRRINKKSILRSKSLVVLTELASISSKQNRNGFSIRDLRPLQDGNYYLPAFSIPYVGKEIAKSQNRSFKKFWGKHYAKALGAAKAELLVLYGMQMKTPNAQNWLIQLDKKLMPTGKLVMRDAADSNYVHFAARSGINQEFLYEDTADRYTIFGTLEPEYWNSVWQMGEGGVAASTLNKWKTLHDAAYIKTVRDILGTKVKFNTIGELGNFLESEDGQTLLRSFHEKNGTAPISIFIKDSVKSRLAA